jgi:hypothetical protein
MISLVIRAVVWPVILVVSIVFIGVIAGAYWAPARLMSAAWLGWIAVRGARNATLVWRGILRGKPWRDEYYRSLYYQGSSRREAFQESGVAPVRDPLLALAAGLMAIGLVYSFFRPSALQPSSAPDSSNVRSSTENVASDRPR